MLGVAVGQSSFYIGSVWPTDPREDLGNFLDLRSLKDLLFSLKKEVNIVLIGWRWAKAFVGLRG